LIQRDIVNLLSRKLLANEIRGGSSFAVDVEKGELIIKPNLVNQVFLN
jgi:ATP-dependent Clp protease ATP-binding subunit ClpA